MRRLAVAFLVGFLGTTLVLAAAFAPKGGVTHHNLLGVTEQTSPTAVANDRPLLEFVTGGGQTCVMTYQARDGTFIAVNVADGTTCPTIPTTTTTTTTTVTTTTVTTTTTSTTTTTT